MLEFSLNILRQFVIVFILVSKCVTISYALSSLSRSFANGLCTFDSFHRYVGYQSVILMYRGSNI